MILVTLLLGICYTITFLILNYFNYQFSYTLYLHFFIKGVLCVHTHIDIYITLNVMYMHIYINPPLYLYSMKRAWEMNNVYANYMQLLLRLQF